jgi:hypothetical protein
VIFSIKFTKLRTLMRKVGLQSAHQQRSVSGPTTLWTAALAWPLLALPLAGLMPSVAATSARPLPTKTRQGGTAPWGRPCQRWCVVA